MNSRLSGILLSAVASAVIATSAAAQADKPTLTNPAANTVQQKAAGVAKENTKPQLQQGAQQANVKRDPSLQHKGVRPGGAQMAPHDQSGNAGQGPGQTGYERKANSTARTTAAGSRPGVQMGEHPPGEQGGYGGPKGGQRNVAGQPNPAANAVNSRGTRAAGQHGGQGPSTGGGGFPQRQVDGMPGQPNPAANAVKGMQ